MADGRAGLMAESFATCNLQPATCNLQTSTIPHSALPALFPTETEIYILPDGQVLFADLPAELADLAAQLGSVLPCAVERESDRGSGTGDWGLGTESLISNLSFTEIE
jgi:hypothetical protein